MSHLSPMKNGPIKLYIHLFIKFCIRQTKFASKIQTGFLAWIGSIPASKLVNNPYITLVYPCISHIKLTCFI